MKQFSFTEQIDSGYGSLIERIEIIRSRLRLKNAMDINDILRLLDEIGELRREMMFLSRGDNRRVTVVANSIVTAKRRKTPEKQAITHKEMGFEGVLGESLGIQESLQIVKKSAPTNLPILIDGESGTGKELFAKVIHANSQRTEQPFISINCGAIPENLIESELFGHKKGAFTGANRDRAGRFESANGGTIFLDEVGELPLAGQAKLLRVLQASEIQRVGSDEAIAVDTRIVAATNRNLAEMAREGTFREDLYYRLSVIHVSLPALRERRDEIPLLCEYYFNESARELQRDPPMLSARLDEFLHTYDYPGNVRELRNIIYRLSCLAEDIADTRHLPKDVRPGGSDGTAVLAVAGNSLNAVKKAASDAAERRFLESGLRRTKGRVVDLAKELDLNRSHLQTLLKKHGIQSKAFKVNSAQT